MAVYDILKKVKNVLDTDATILTYVTKDNIRVAEQPNTKVAKEITLRKEFGRSDSILEATNPTVFVTVWVKQKEVDQPYSVASTIVDKVIDLLNRKGTSLNSSTLVVHQMVKTDASIRYDDSQEYWVGSIIFDVVTNE